MALQPVPISTGVIPVQNTSIMTLPNTSIMTLPNTDVSSLPNTSIGFPQPILNPLDMAYSSIDTFYPVGNQLKDNEALREIPLNVVNLEFLKTAISTIDTDVPRTLEIITPNQMVNYYEHYYGDVTVDYLQPNELTLSAPSRLDTQILPIELGRNTRLDFIGFDEGMSFIVTNGTSPENVVIAENMATEDIGHSVLLSLNENSEQNVELIHSSNIQPTRFSIDIPVGLSAMEVSKIVTDISEKTETIQIVSPDFVTETSHDEQTIVQLASLGNLVNLWYGSKQSFLSDRFGSLSPKQIRDMLENPVLFKQQNPDLFKDQILSNPNADDFTSGTLFLTIHGQMVSHTLVDVDCTGIDQLSFIGRNGLVLSVNSLKQHNFAHQNADVNFYATRQTAVGQICRVPELKFNADRKGNKNEVFGLFHTNPEGKMTPVITNHDLIEIFGHDYISLTTILNLVQIVSGGSQHVQLNIAACMLVHPDNRKVHLTEFRISYKAQDIPHFFDYEPQVLEAKEVQRVKGLAPDRFCRFGAEQRRVDAGKACVEYLSKKDDSEVIKLDPHQGLSGEGIREALSNKELIPDVFVVFPNEQRMRANHFNVLLNWHKKRLTFRLFKELHEIGIDEKISLSDIIPELDEIFSSFPTEPQFSDFMDILKKKLKGDLRKINSRVAVKADAVPAAEA